MDPPSCILGSERENEKEDRKKQRTGRERNDKREEDWRVGEVGVTVT